MRRLPVSFSQLSHWRSQQEVASSRWLASRPAGRGGLLLSGGRTWRRHGHGQRGRKGDAARLSEGTQACEGGVVRTCEGVQRYRKPRGRWSSKRMHGDVQGRCTETAHKDVGGAMRLQLLLCLCRGSIGRLRKGAGGHMSGWHRKARGRYVGGEDLPPAIYNLPCWLPHWFSGEAGTEGCKWQSGLWDVINGCKCEPVANDPDRNHVTIRVLGWSEHRELIVTTICSAQL